ncbi:MAG: hypothetical protein Q4D02_01700 [Clostridia bacterium]|nr:hypothetical protein [Clostridia bacterium]
MKNYIGLTRSTFTVIDQKSVKKGNYTRAYLLYKCSNCNRESWIRADYFKNIKYCVCNNPTLFKCKDYSKITKYGITFLEPVDKTKKRDKSLEM